MLIVLVSLQGMSHEEKNYEVKTHKTLVMSQEWGSTLGHADRLPFR